MAGQYQDNTWTTGDYLTQTKMRQHIVNEQYLRERTDFADVAYPGVVNTDSPGPGNPTPDIYVQLKIDGSVKATATVNAGNGDFKLADILTGVAYGLHTVQLVLVGGAGVNGAITRFILRQEHAFATCWGTLTQASMGDPALRTTVLKSVSLITHRTAQYW